MNSNDENGTQEKYKFVLTIILFLTGPSSLEYSSKDKNMMIIVALSVAGFVIVLIMVNIKLFFEMRKKIKANQQESRDQNVDR